MLDFPSDNIDTLDLNVTSNENVASIVDIVISKHGQIDILDNNAGIGSIGPLAKLPLEELKKAWEINTLGQLRLVQQVVPYMASRYSGSIVNIGSVMGMVATPWVGSYCTSKSYVHAMSNSLHLELRPFGINVVLVVLGAVKSNFGSAVMENLGKNDWKLYKDYKKVITLRAKASQNENGMDVRVFARHVGKKVLRLKLPKQIVFGYMSGLVSPLSLAPIWMRDFFIASDFGP